MTSHSSPQPAPPDFAAEVAQARAQDTLRARLGDLLLLGQEALGLPWQVAGLRLVAQAQFGLGADDHARATWEQLHQQAPDDPEATAALATLSQRPSRPADVTPEPPHTLLFTGHVIDAPTRATPRFPAAKEPLARQAIQAAVQQELNRLAGRAVVGLTGAASGGDILFQEVCAELGVPTRLYLALPHDQYVQASVQGAGPGWVARFEQLYQRLPRRVLSPSEELPEWLRAKSDYNLWKRNNLWMLYHALALGSTRTTLLALWDGEPAGNGPGGTQDMVAQAEHHGARTVVLATKSIFGLN